MINYYKILGIENYAAAADIKAAYRSKIRRYHPDINPSDEAREVSRWLNQAKDVLLDSGNKEQYDLQLQHAYIQEIQRLRNSDRFTDLIWQRKQRQQMKEQEKLRQKQRYEAGLKWFPYPYRVGILCLLAINGLWLFYANYFYTANGREILYSSLGVFLFVLSVLILGNQIYAHFWSTAMDRFVKFNYERWVSRFLVITLVGGIMGIYGLNEYRKVYSLEHNFSIVPGQIELNAKDKSMHIYRYRAAGQEYTKPIRVDVHNVHLIHQGTVRVKYANADPRISILVE